MKKQLTFAMSAPVLTLSLAFGAAAGEAVYTPGATVVADPDSPTGYTVTFVLENPGEDVTEVTLNGTFGYLSPDMEPTDEGNGYTAEDYENGMYPSDIIPGWMFTGAGVPVHTLEYVEEADVYTVSLPISSGSFKYGFNLTHADGSVETIADPVNPAPALANPNSNTATGDINNSIVYGMWDAEKQSESPNFDYVRPCEGEKGEVTFVEYTGVLGDDQDLGIYTPAGYDPEREEPYRVVYASHGGGGSEVCWLGYGHVDNIIDNLGADVLVVTMDNTALEWDFAKIEENVLDYIIPYMEANYNVSTEAKDRAFCGLSMGCMTTFHMFFDHPEAFGYFGGFSGPDLSAVKDNEGIHDPTLFVTVGLSDIASSRIIPNGEGQQIKYEDFVAWLEENPMDNVILGGYLPGSHDWFVWSESFKTFVEEICWK